MRTTCLINSYNYRRFVSDAVASALDQTVPFDEVILVDDGSTDGSLEAVLDRFGDEATLKIIAKENEGQLSCFNAGWEASMGDLVFFLDADDLYEPEYLAEALRIYQAEPEVDFVFVHYREFGPASAQRAARDVPDRNFGYTLLPALFTGQWLGAPTSCLSMRRELLGKVLPIPNAEDWRTRADDCLILGASLACGSKYFLGKPLVRYRRHGDNRHAGRRLSPGGKYRHRVKINRLVKLFSDRMGYDVDRLPVHARHEFRTMRYAIPFSRLRKYARIVLQARMGMITKCRMIADMTCHFALSHLRRRPAKSACPPRGPRPSPANRRDNSELVQVNR